MANVASISPHLRTLAAPPALRTLAAWVLWRYEHAAGETKARKIPYYANGARRFGVQGSPKDRAQLATFDAAKKAASARGFDGVGLALMPEFGVTALDFDDCVTAKGLDPAVESMLSGTYAEYSPSGKGVRAFVVGALGNKKSYSNATQYGFETFHDKGFVTFTGQVLEITELTGCESTIGVPTKEVLALYASRFSVSAGGEYTAESEPIIGLTEEQITQCMKVLDPNVGHDDWLHIGMGLHHETGGDGFAVWDDWSSLGHSYPGREALEARWLSFGQSHAGRPITARSLVRSANLLGAEIPIDVCAPSDFEVLAEPVAPAGGYFRVRSAANFMTQVKPVEWLIKSMLPHATLGVLYGESGSGKSFVALDICASLSRGKNWNNLKTRKARVLYVVAEGVGGFNNRIKAYCHQAGIKPEDLDIDIISDVTPNIMETSHINALISDIKAFGPYAMVVMDTYAQVTPGANENSGEDMGKALGHCRKISQLSSALVLLVHHSGKDASKGARGWSGLKAAADVELEVTRFENDRCISVTKLKDGQDGVEFGFRLHDVVLGQDEDGDDITSCVVEYTESKQPKRKTKTLKANQKLVLSQLHELAGLSGGTVTITALIEASVNQTPHDPESRSDNRRRDALRAINTLQSLGMCSIESGFISISVEK